MSRPRTLRTTRRSIAAAGILALSAVASLGQLAPAEAQAQREDVSSARATAVFTDTAGDIDHGADLRRVRVVNGNEVRVRVTHADLRRSWRSGSSLTVYFDTEPQWPGPEYALTGGTYQGTDYALVRTDGWRLRDGAPSGCQYGMELDYAADTALLRIGRGCLGQPEALRVAVRTAGEKPNGDTVVDWLGRRRHLTRPIARG